MIGRNKEFKIQVIICLVSACVSLGVMVQKAHSGVDVGLEWDFGTAKAPGDLSHFYLEQQELQTDGTTGLDLPDALTTLVEAHVQVRWRGLHLRGLATRSTVDDAGALNVALGNAPGGTGIAEEMLGAYGEIAYELWQWISPGSEMTLEPFYRYEWIDTQQTVPTGFVRDETLRNQIHTLGLSYKPIPNVVLKADYRNVAAEAGSPADEINLGIGLVF